MESTKPTPDPTLTPLHREAGFLAALIVGLPALVFAYVLGWNLIEDAGSTPIGDAAGTIAALVALLAGNPITVYLTARQYPRGKSVEAVGMADAVRVQVDGAIAAAAPAETLASNPPVNEPVGDALPQDTPLDGEQVLDYTTPEG